MSDLTEKLSENCLYIAYLYSVSQLLFFIKY